MEKLIKINSKVSRKFHPFFCDDRMSRINALGKVTLLMYYYYQDLQDQEFSPFTNAFTRNRKIPDMHCCIFQK